MKHFILSLFSFFLFSINACFCSEKFEDIHAATKLLFKALEKKKPIDTLIELGANLNDTTIKGAPPLAYAIKQRNEAAIDVLLPLTDLSSTYEENKTFLHEAIDTADHCIIKILVNAYSQNKLLEQVVNIPNSDKNSPFHLLALHTFKCLERAELIADIRPVLSIFQKSGGDLEAKNSKGETIQTILKKAQAELTTFRRLKLGWTAMHIAMKGPDLTLEGENVDDMWTFYNADPLGVNIQNSNGTTPFLILAYKYLKFKEKEKEKTVNILKLLKLMHIKGALIDLENKAGISVSKLLGAKFFT